MVRSFADNDVGRGIANIDGIVIGTGTEGEVEVGAGTEGEVEVEAGTGVVRVGMDVGTTAGAGGMAPSGGVVAGRSGVEETVDTAAVAGGADEVDAVDTAACVSAPGVGGVAGGTVEAVGAEAVDTAAGVDELAALMEWAIGGVDVPAVAGGDDGGTIEGVDGIVGLIDG